MENEPINPTPKSNIVAYAIIALALVAALGGGYVYYTNSHTIDSGPSDTPIDTSPVTIKEPPPPEPHVATSTKSYTLAQVAAHNKESDCWLTIEGKVYDVTAFIPSHPGGKAIIGGCGKDATVLFNERPTNDKGPHPAQARELLPKYEIGILAQ